jgi:hypothetical protein
MSQRDRVGFAFRMRYECELVLREGLEDKRSPHTFSVAVTPGTAVHFDGVDWVIVEVNERDGLVPEVVARRPTSSK